MCIHRDSFVFAPENSLKGNRKAKRSIRFQISRMNFQPFASDGKRAFML